MSRRSARSRSGGAAAKARRGAPANPGGVTLSGDQLTAVLAANTQAALATPLPRPPQWSTDPFGPGSPLRPSPINAPNPRTGRAEPRLFELPISTNLNVNTAPFVPWRILSEAADMPLFRKCIERRKSVCGLGYTIAVDPKAVAREAAKSGQASKDVESAMLAQYMPDIARISDWMENPDRKNGYDWEQLDAQLMENRLVYDAIVVYPKRTLRRRRVRPRDPRRVNGQAAPRRVRRPPAAPGPVRAADPVGLSPRRVPRRHHRRERADDGARRHDAPTSSSTRGR